MSFSVLIGLEIHIELKTKSKMFCRCAADYFGEAPNTHVCPVCLGLPGALPYANQKAIEWTIMMGLALDCQIASLSKFDRKNYFYPDLPKGYQISQYDLPLCQNGKFNGVRIKRVHLEEDTGKLFHKKLNSKDVTLIDFNRSGVPLVEVVTEPDIHSASQAKEFLKNLWQLVRSLGVSDANMEKGQMRCEPTVNLEIKKDNQVFYTPLAELKNINSFRFVEKAIEYEIKRQKEEFEKTGIAKQPGNKTTRGWDEKKQQTVLQREKEEAADYRYFPEPDLPPMRLTITQIDKIRNQIPELPEQKVLRLMKNYHLPEHQARILLESEEKVDYFEKAIKLALKDRINFKEVANIIINKKVDIEKTNPEQLVKMLAGKKSTPKMSQEDLIKKITEIIKSNPQAVEQFKKGKPTVVEFLVGQIMAQTKGQADPSQIREILCEKL
ncbi:MAG: Asp-tRNA(Asn)/Glu-tRNA(Gln) amidotransferase subunit GatB, partial [Candidatus Shapirobacteria bacterium]|nr:Asp-tRNA(Asn)/Glu-tRNA(Gln) amidotransferase subunit GatB [Candidatus Shapirobacteria bacterium]